MFCRILILNINSANSMKDVKNILIKYPFAVTYIETDGKIHKLMKDFCGLKFSSLHNL